MFAIAIKMYANVIFALRMGSVRGHGGREKIYEPQQTALTVSQV
jgi:hypothetical protein